MGLYKLAPDGQTYVSIYDPSVTLMARDLPATPGLITPAKDLKKPLQRSFWAIDPRDGTNYLERVVMIGSAPMGPGPNPLAMPNGIRDADEYSWARTARWCAARPSASARRSTTGPSFFNPAALALCTVIVRWKSANPKPLQARAQP